MDRYRRGNGNRADVYGCALRREERRAASHTGILDGFVDLRIISGVELEPGEYDAAGGGAYWGKLLGGEAADLESAFRSFASLSALRCADIDVGWRDTLSTLLACGSEESWQERLGSAISWSGAERVLEEEDVEEEDFLICEDMVRWVGVGERGTCRRCGGGWKGRTRLETRRARHAGTQRRTVGAAGGGWEGW